MNLKEAKHLAETLTIVHDLTNKHSFTAEFNKDYPYEAVVYELNTNYKDFEWSWSEFKVGFEVKLKEGLDVDQEQKKKEFYL